MNQENFAWAVEQLQKKYNELSRLPKKDDFDEKTRSRIKAYLGPWPRALEAAGLKTPRVIPEKSAKRRKAATKSKNQTFSAHQKFERQRTKSSKTSSNS